MKISIILIDVQSLTLWTPLYCHPLPGLVFIHVHLSLFGSQNESIQIAINGPRTWLTYGLLQFSWPFSGSEKCILLEYLLQKDRHFSDYSKLLQSVVSVMVLYFARICQGRVDMLWYRGTYMSQYELCMSGYIHTTGLLFTL